MFKNAKAIYISFASLCGLFLIIIGCIGLLQLALSIYFHTPQSKYQYQPPMMQSYDIDFNNINGLTSSQIKALIEWQKDYEMWRKEQNEFDWNKKNKNDALIFSLAMLIVGLPIFIVHIRLMNNV